jgi:hypothetical protein
MGTDGAKTDGAKIGVCDSIAGSITSTLTPQGMHDVIGVSEIISIVCLNNRSKSRYYTRGLTVEGNSNLEFR